MFCLSQGCSGTPPATPSVTQRLLGTPRTLALLFSNAHWTTGSWDRIVCHQWDQRGPHIESWSSTHSMMKTAYLRAMAHTEDWFGPAVGFKGFVLCLNISHLTCKSAAADIKYQIILHQTKNIFITTFLEKLELLEFMNHLNRDKGEVHNWKFLHVLQIIPFWYPPTMSLHYQNSTLRHISLVNPFCRQKITLVTRWLLYHCTVGQCLIF